MSRLYASLPELRICFRTLLALTIAFVIALLPISAVNPGDTDNKASLLTADRYHHYVNEFQQQEAEATGKQSSDDPWPWMLSNIPWFDSSDKQFEETYYFRWYAWQKHVIQTPKGYVITEFLPKVGWGGYYNTIADAAPHHMYEARWLRNKQIAEDYARFWMSPDAAPRKYSFWVADSVRAITLATGNSQLGIDLLPALEENYRAWQKSNQDTNGLFWQIDTRDAMEKSISGSGYRPTLNSYMYGDAAAIAAFAAKAKDTAAKSEFESEAKERQQRVEHDLWNPQDQFYEARTPRGPDPQFAGVRELLGYIPWYFHLPAADHAIAWKQLFDPQGFAGKYGPTTAERRSPRFRFTNSDKCQWNGPSWPFATTQTLIAMANLENDQDQNYVGHDDYYRLFSEYVLSQHLRLDNGKLIPWIDEDLDADTGKWIARDILAQRKDPSAGRGAYYNHSGFADPLITGLIGLRPSDDNKIVLHPLLPESAWNYLALDGVPYHGHLLTIVYDKTGKQYHRGRGFMLFVDGKKKASRNSLGPLEYALPSNIQ